MQVFKEPLYCSSDVLLVCVDVQERLMKVMAESERVLANGNRLLSAARILSIPVCVSEQYVKGLGKSVLDIAGFPCFEKSTFSVFGDDDIVSFFKKTSFKKVVFFGIESHVCIFQSLVHARKLGLETLVIADACSSRSLSNHQLAMQAVAQEGVQVIATESFLFGLLLSCKEEHFKPISALVK